MGIEERGMSGGAIHGVSASLSVILPLVQHIVCHRGLVARGLLGRGSNSALHYIGGEYAMGEQAGGDRTVRLGIIGAGLAVKWLHWPPLQGLGARFQVVAVADIVPAAAQEVAGLVGGARW